MSERLLIRGRVLVLGERSELVTRQLAGEDIAFTREITLAENISTDEMAPGWASYYFDERLGRYCLVGFRGGVIGEGAIERGGFEVLVGGPNFGCGSSRETAPYAQLAAGVRLVIAPSFARIYRQNCQNIGLFTSCDFGLLERLREGALLDPEELTDEKDALTADIVRSGGLLAHAQKRLKGALKLPPLGRRARAQTLAEKIIAAHAVSETQTERTGVAAVAPGDSLMVRADLRFSHEYVTPMADALLRRTFGDAVRVADPASILLFRDHLTFVEHVLGRDARRLPLLEQARLLPLAQERFAERQGIRLFGEVRENGATRGSHAICHEEMLETFAEPGMLICGTDSHTSTAGAVGCLAFGVGSSDMAAAWMTRDVRLRVPETVRVVLRGRLPPGTCAKDVMLTLFGSELVRSGGASGRVLEFGGDGLATLSLDERATLANMAVEAGALTGIVPADARTFAEIAGRRRDDGERLRARTVAPDQGADYTAEIALDLGAVEPMLALPGDPKNVIPLAELAHAGESPRIDIAYGGSCTGAKRADMDLYAAVLVPAAARGQRVASGVRLFVQMGSQAIRRYAAERGYIDAFEAVGATVLDPACGACIAAGPGTSFDPGEVTVSASSRNFPGRSGPGRVILASPLVVAASALAGRVTAPALGELT